MEFFEYNNVKRQKYDSMSSLSRSFIIICNCFAGKSRTKRILETKQHDGRTDPTNREEVLGVARLFS